MCDIKYALYLHRLKETKTTDPADTGKLKKQNKMNASAIYNGLNFTTREINFNFRIKVQYIDENGKKVNTLEE